jgi:hypothetical protein
MYWRYFLLRIGEFLVGVLFGRTLYLISFHVYSGWGKR